MTAWTDQEIAQIGADALDDTLKRTLIWHFRTIPTGWRNNVADSLQRLARGTDEVGVALAKLNTNLESANQSSDRLAGALNRITFWGLIVAGLGVLVAFLNFGVDMHWWGP